MLTISILIHPAQIKDASRDLIWNLLMKPLQLLPCLLILCSLNNWMLKEIRWGGPKCFFFIHDCTPRDISSFTGLSPFPKQDGTQTSHTQLYSAGAFVFKAQTGVYQFHSLTGSWPDLSGGLTKKNISLSQSLSKTRVAQAKMYGVIFKTKMGKLTSGQFRE